MFYIKNKQVYAFPIPGYTNTIREEDWAKLNASAGTKIAWRGDTPVAVAKEKWEMKEALIAQQQAYLDGTDWYVSRFAETGVEIPAEVKEKRAAARAEIDALRALEAGEQEGSNAA